MGHCKVKCNLCSMQQVCWGLCRRGLRQGWAGGLVGGAVLLVCYDFHRRRQHSATAVHRTLPVCEWPALGMPWATVRPNAAFDMSSRLEKGLHWVLRKGWAGGLRGLRFCRCVEISRGGGSTRQPQCTEPCQRVSGEPWAFQGALQGKIQPLQCATGVVGPLLRAAAGPGRWFVGVMVLPVCGDFQSRSQHSATTAHRALPVCE